MEQEIERTTALALPDEGTFRRDIQAINRFQEIVHSNMVKDQDYGIIPGTTKPTLLKPGAEKIAKLLGLSDTYEILDRQEDWSKPFFRYLIKCSLSSVKAGVVISEGLGECNSMESKYRWRSANRKCPQCGAEAIIKGKAEYGGGWLCFAKKGGCGAKWTDGATEIGGQETGKVENEDIYSQVNTILKMAKKRALVDAALSAGRLSNVFTQDIEDIPSLASVVETPAAKPAKAAAAPTAQQGGNVGVEAEFDKLFGGGGKAPRTREAIEDEIRNILKAKGYNPQECKSTLYESVFAVMSLSQLSEDAIPKALEWAKALKAKGG